MAFWGKEVRDGDQKEVIAEPKVEGSDKVQVKESSATDKKSNSKKVSSDDFERYIENKFGKLRSALGSGTVISGKLSFDTPVRIDGKLKGEVFSSDVVIIGPEADVEAELDVEHLIIKGKVSGSVVAKQKIELLSKSHLSGSIKSPKLSIEEGSSFDGSCTMNLDSNKRIKVNSKK